MLHLGTALAHSIPFALLTASTHAGFTMFQNDFEGWSAATGSYTTLDFVFEESAIMNDQYLDLGVLFPDMEEVAYSHINLFPQDGWGLQGAPIIDDDIHMLFLEPQYSLGVWFPGHVQARLYYQGELVHETPTFNNGPTPYGFAGVISTLPFDEVILVDPIGGIVVDDILFGVPAPGTLAILGLGVIGRSRRRPS